MTENIQNGTNQELPWKGDYSQPYISGLFDIGVGIKIPITAFHSGIQIDLQTLHRLVPKMDENIHVLTDTNGFSWIGFGARHHPDVWQFLTQRGVSVDSDKALALQIMIKQGMLDKIVTATRIGIPQERTAQAILNMLPPELVDYVPQLRGGLGESKTIVSDIKYIAHEGIISDQPNFEVGGTIIDRKIQGKKPWTLLTIRMDNFPKELIRQY